MDDQKPRIPLGVDLSSDIEFRPDRGTPYRARLRWVDPLTGRQSLSRAFADQEAARDWIAKFEAAARRGLAPHRLKCTLEEYGTQNWDLAMRGLEPKTMDPYRAGWKLRILPAMGHLQVIEITNGITDRVLCDWVADEVGRSSVKNTLAALVRIMEQAVRDGLIENNPCRLAGWQRLYKRTEDELDDPRSLALRDWTVLETLADALATRSYDQYRGWGDVVRFAACTAARIGEVSGVRARDINTVDWTWEVCRQTTPAPGGVIDKNTKGKRRRTVPLIEEIRPLVKSRLAAVGNNPDARLFRGPKGGRITTAILRDATHWDEVVTRLGLEHLRRHDLRHTGLTWMADAGIKIHVLKAIAGHSHITTTERYLHPSLRTIRDAGAALSAHLQASRPDGGGAPDDGADAVSSTPTHPLTVEPQPRRLYVVR
ncbi:tyrosine-type recombinase/integrase [Streptacidiphilus fuscans]|uniref:Site-specific integrase n=1 Tax=Streptacidiphilus fuscans TaxID=2789292 RepID=A0A931FGY0_9ACTN|nr:site-specific integrase [Streptacidiphilus fuscans]MBF9071735.1 site-specific integrase [Streptacidiphilus fuscans]